MDMIPSQSGGNVRPPNPPVNVDTDQKPKNEKEEVKQWLDRVTIARRYRDRVQDELGVSRFVKQYLGTYDVRLGNIMVPAINDVFAYTQALIAGLYNKEPYIAVNARKTGTVKGAHILEVAVNYYWRELKIKEENELELMDVTLAGDAWHKTAYLAQSIGTGETLKLKSEKIYSNRVSYKDIVYNIGSRKAPKDCMWIAQRIVRPTQDVKDEYGAAAAKLKGGPHPALNDSEFKSANFKSDLNFSTLWEIWDAREKKIRLVAEGLDRYLKKPVNWPEHLDEFPFDNLWFNAIIDEPFHMPDIKPWEPQILEKIKILAMILNHMKRWNRQLIVRKGAIDVPDMDKFEKGIDGSIIEVNVPGNESINNVMTPATYAPLPPEVWTLLNKLDEIANNVNGQPAFDRGGSTVTKTRTLGELEYMKGGSKSRTDRKVNRLEVFLGDIARKIIANMKANFDLEETVYITGDTPQEIMEAFQDKIDPATGAITFTKEDIKGEYDVTVRAGSTLPLDRETRLQVLSQVLQQSVQLAQLPGIPPFIQVVIQEILKDYDIKALEAAFADQLEKQQQTEQSQAVQQATELDKVKAEAEKRKAQAEQVRTDTAIQTGEALHRAHLAGVLPEAIELGRGMGQFPLDGGPNGA